MKTQAPLLFPLYVSLILVAMITILNVIPRKMTELIMYEGGIVEFLSAFAWLATAVVIIVWGRGREPKLLQIIALALLPLFCSMRELDLHKAWTTDSILKPQYYLESYASGQEKLIAGIVLLIFIAALVYVCISYGRLFISNMRAWEWCAINLSFAFLLLFVSQIFLDGEVNPPFIATIEEAFMEIIAPAWQHKFLIILYVAEESIEMIAAMLVLLVSISWVRQKQIG